MKAGRRGGLCRVSLVGNALAARLLPFSAKKRNRIWKFRVSKCDFFLDVVEMWAWRVRSAGGLAAA